MADVKWTDAQLEAIEGRGNILVSAAAGSGKTATLSAKIMHLLRTVPDVSLSDFLIVTYTNAAAAELKERIGREITKAAKASPEMLRHKRDVAAADICTIHSFCLKLVRRYFTQLGLPPELSVADEVLAKTLKSRAMETTTRDFLTGELKLEGPCDIYSLADTIGKTKDAEGLDAQLRDLLDKMVSFGLGDDFPHRSAEALTSAVECDLIHSPWGKIISGYALDSAKYYLSRLLPVIEAMKESEKVVENYMPAANILREYLERIIASADSYEGLRAAVISYDHGSIKSLTAKFKTDASEEFKAIRDEMKKHFTSTADKFFASTAEEFADAAGRTAEIDRAIGQVLDVYKKRYDTLKRERGVLDFADLESLALRLLVNEDGTPTSAALEAGEKYRFVFIDEYQDTNYVQDRIFGAVSHSAEKFFVGDIKQSIYRFRGAEPEVFAGYRRAWDEGETPRDDAQDSHGDGRSVFMSENFRCAEPIIKFVNAVSRFMFPYGGIPFSESDCLVYGGVTRCEEPVEVCLIDSTISKSDEDEAVGEAEYVAERIYRLIKEENVAPSDIAILLRNANKTGVEYENALVARGIPTNRDGGSSFADEAEVMLTLSILRAVDNPTRDIPLASAMLSSVFGFTLEELVTLRAGRRECSLYSSVLEYAEGDSPLAEKCRTFAERLEALRNAERGMSADAFIEYLYGETRLTSCPEVTSKLFGEKNLRAIYELARAYESGTFGGLYGFLTFIDEKLASGALVSQSKSEAGGVSILSIHKSKGLEFKVCFLSECGKKRSDKDEKAEVLVDSELGIGMLLPDPSGLILCGNAIRDSLVLKSRLEGAKEEMRVLYVALTRARERLIITAKTKKRPADMVSLTLSSEDTCEFSVLSLNKMIDIILRGIGTDSSLNPRITIVEKGEEISALALDREETAEQTEREESTADVTSAESAIAFRYPYAHLSTIPSKLSVSALYPNVLDYTEPETLSLVETFDDETETEAEVLPTPVMPRPRFMTGAVDTTPADRGISNHTFLQFADFEALRRDGVAAETARLVEKRFITEKMATLLSPRQLERFAHDGLVDRILSAPTVLREFRFNLPLPASSFTTDGDLKQKLDQSGEKITVQGVFDCVFEDAEGRLVLVDYKTDGMSAYEMSHPESGRAKLRERHTRQLTYYSAAVKELFGRAPDEIYVYSLTLGEAVPVEVRL